MGFPAVNEPAYARHTAAATPPGNQASTLQFGQLAAFAGDQCRSEGIEAKNII